MFMLLVALGDMNEVADAVVFPLRCVTAASIVPSNVNEDAKGSQVGYLQACQDHLGIHMNMSLSRVSCYDIILRPIRCLCAF